MASSNTLVLTAVLGSVAFSQIARAARDEAAQAHPNALAKSEVFAKAEFFEAVSMISLGAGLGLGLARVLKPKAD
jgi:hypothetical protein